MFANTLAFENRFFTCFGHVKRYVKRLGSRHFQNKTLDAYFILQHQNCGVSQPRLPIVPDYAKVPQSNILRENLR